MAYDEGLAERVRQHFASRLAQGALVEKKMFGGLAFMVSGHMCVGVNADSLMARVGPEQYEAALARPHAREMNFTGRSLKGFLYIDPEGYASDQDLGDWIGLCEGFVATLPPK